VFNVAAEVTRRIQGGAARTHSRTLARRTEAPAARDRVLECGGQNRVLSCPDLDGYTTRSPTLRGRAGL